MKARKLFLPIVLLVASLLLASGAYADTITYDFTFTSSGMNATGTLTITNGVVQSGSITVTGIPLEANPSMLISASGSLIPGSGNATDHNGDVVTYDNLVNLANDPVLDGNGLAFGSGQYGATQYNTLIGLNGGDIYGNIPPIEYTLFVGEAVPGDNEYVYTYISGNLTLTEVPEPATLPLLGSGLVGFAGVIRRRLRS